MIKLTATIIVQAFKILEKTRERERENQKIRPYHTPKCRRPNTNNYRFIIINTTSSWLTSVSSIHVLWILFEQETHE